MSQYEMFGSCCIGYNIMIFIDILVFIFLLFNLIEPFHDISIF